MLQNFKAFLMLMDLPIGFLYSRHSLENVLSQVMLQYMSYYRNISSTYTNRNQNLPKPMVIVFVN